MSPSFTTDYFGNGFAANAINSGDVLVHRAVGGKAANFAHHRVGQLCSGNIHATRLLVEVGFSRVAAVLAAANPFKIFKTVVLLVTVYVIDLRVIVGVLQESMRDETMNVSLVRLAASGQKYLHIAGRLHSGFQYLADIKARVNNSVKRPDIASAGNLIPAFKAFNRQPNFYVVHTDFDTKDAGKFTEFGDYVARAVRSRP